MSHAALDTFARRHRYHPLEALPWVLAVAAYAVFPSYLPLGSQILATILFAMSADLVLGYAGIVTLGHAAFFGTGAYAAGILAAHGWGEPITGLLAAALAAALLGLISGLIVLRTTGLTLLMQTLVVATLLAEAPTRRRRSPAATMDCRAWRCGQSLASSASICLAGPLMFTASPSCSYAGGGQGTLSIRRSGAP